MIRVESFFNALHIYKLSHSYLISTMQLKQFFGQTNKIETLNIEVITNLV